MIVPHNKHVLCRCIVPAKEEISGAIAYTKENMPIYEIINIANDINDYLVGDKIITNSTGTKILVEKEYQYLFNINNIAGKIYE